MNVRIINKNSDCIVKLEKWFINNPNGWKTSIASWSTPDLLLTGKEFRLLIFKDAVIISFKGQFGKRKQYIKRVDVSNFSYLLNDKYCK